jgi:type II secretion system protein C
LAEQSNHSYFIIAELAHRIKFDDNKLMINKIKDFLKNRFARKRADDLSDQDSGDEENFSDEGQEDVPNFSQEDESPEQVDDHVEDEHVDYETAASATSKTSLTSIKELTRKFRSSLKLPEWKKPEFGKGGGGSGGGPGFTVSPSISKYSEKFLSRSSRESVHQVSLVLLVCSLTYTLGKVTALVLKGKPMAEGRRYAVSIPLDKEFQPGTLAQVRSINIFRTNTGLNKKKATDTKCDQATQNSDLNIKLVNTVVLQDSVKSIASVQVQGDRDLKEVREGDEIPNMAKIFHINRLELIVKNLTNGACESIATAEARERNRPLSVMSPSQATAFKASKKISGIENVGNKFTIQKSLLDDKLKDIAQILTQARAVKIQNPDGSISFKMTEMDPEGLFPYLGLQDGDIITSINGKPIYDMNEIMGLFGRIKNLDKLQLGIKRDGTESNQDYTIKK